MVLQRRRVCMADLTAQLLAWLEEDRIPCAAAPRPPAGTTWALEARIGDVPVKTYGLAGLPGLQVQALMVLAPEHQAAYDAATREQRAAFERSVHRAFMLQLPGYSLNANPSVKGFHVILSRTLYPETLTRQAYMDALLMVHRMAYAFALLAREHLEMTRAVAR